MTIVTAYAALGQDGLSHSLAETNSSAIFTSASLLKNIANILPQLPNLQNIIYVGKADDEVLRAFNETGRTNNVIPYKDFIELGSRNPIDPTPPRPVDIACVMYTSGTTGPPKGVILTHQNIIASGNYPCSLFSFGS